MKGTQQAKASYIKYKNTLTKTIRLAKKTYFTNQLTLYKHDIQNTWKILKQAMNLSKNKSDITKIMSIGDIVEDPTNIANTFNDYFINVTQDLCEPSTIANMSINGIIDNFKSHPSISMIKEQVRPDQHAVQQSLWFRQYLT